MTSDTVGVKISARIQRSHAPQPGSVTRDDVVQALDACARDAVSGTYEEFPAPLDEVSTLNATWDDESVLILDDGSAEIMFTLHLPAEMFVWTEGGLQQLLSAIAGDLLPTSFEQLRWTRAVVASLDLPTSVQNQLSLFRPHQAQEKVRASFELIEKQALLAFTMKPRHGFPWDFAYETVLGVLNAGFNLVEFDTRRVDSVDETIEVGTEIAKKLSATKRRRPHVSAFAVNLSMRPDLAVRAAKRWRAVTDEHGIPFVVKVDGGFDGMATMQALRSNEETRHAIITCYPLLSSSLTSRIERDVLLLGLILSGADIVYPGGRPAFPEEVRPIDAGDLNQYVTSQRRYRRLVTEYNIVPSFAGGTHPGNLHPAYQLLGGSTAFFVGSAVALHRDGVGKGAALVAKILRKSMEIGVKCEKGRAQRPSELPAHLILDVRANYQAPSLVAIDQVFDDAGKVRPAWRQ